MSDFIVDPPSQNCPAPSENQGASVTSLVTYDGSDLSCLGIKTGVDLNDAFASLNANCVATNETINSISNSITTISNNLYSVTNTINKLDASGIAITIGGTCLSLGNTVQDAIQSIEEAFCTLQNDVSNINVNNYATTWDLKRCCWKRSKAHLLEAFSGYNQKEMDLGSIVGLTATIQGGTAVGEGEAADRLDNSILLDANSDNYVYVDTADKLDTDGFKKKSVSIGSPEPSFTSTEALIYKFTTDATSVTATEDKRDFTFIDIASISGQIDIATQIGDGTINAAKLNLDAPVDYTADFSTQYTNRTLVDKEYVDNQVAQGGVWTVSGSDLFYDTGGITVGGTTLYAGSKLTVEGAVAIIDGTEQSGYVLTSDSNGLASWQEVGNKIEVFDESSSLNTNIQSINFVGAGVEAVDDTLGNITVTVTGAVAALDDLSDVVVAGSGADEVLFFTGTVWSSSTNFKFDGNKLAVGNPTTIDASLHIKASAGDVLKLEGSGGVYGTIDTAGLFTYNNQIQYTFDNGGSNPLTTNFILADVDGTGKAVWVDPATLAANSLDAVMAVGNTTTYNLLLQAGTPPSIFFDNTVNSIELKSGTITSNKVITLPDLTATLVGTVAGLSTDTVIRGLGTHEIASASFQDDGTNTWFGGSVDGLSRVKIESSEPNSLTVINTYTAGAAYNLNLKYQQTTTHNVHGIFTDIENFGSGVAYSIYAKKGLGYFSEGIKIDTIGDTIDPSAIFDVSSTTQGALLPRMTTAQRTGIGTPATGLLVYDTDLNDMYVWTGASWQNFISTGSGMNWSGISVGAIPYKDGASTIADSPITVSGGNIIVSGDLTVQGTTTTVDSTTTTYVDPIISLNTVAGGGDQTADNGKDVGVEAKWYDGAAKEAFFGFDRSTQRFVYVPDATLTAEVVSGSYGDVQFAHAYLTGATFTGQVNIAGNSIANGTIAHYMDSNKWSLNNSAAGVVMSIDTSTKQIATLGAGSANFLDMSAAGAYTWTMPSATGTVALTSDLGAYLPLAGGTMSGDIVLGGSSAITRTSGNMSLEVNGAQFAFTDGAAASRTIWIQPQTANIKVQHQASGNDSFITIQADVSSNPKVLFHTNGTVGTLNTTLTASDITADRTITLPDADGTVALTSQLSSYLPLAGGTMTGDITIGANQIIGQSSGYITVGAAAINIYNSGGDFAAVSAGSGNVSSFDGTYLGILDMSGRTGNRTWTMPDATGTVALTSDLGAYLPLAGGTMTGNIELATHSISNGAAYFNIQSGSFVHSNDGTNTYTLNTGSGIITWNNGTYSNSLDMSPFGQSASLSWSMPNEGGTITLGTGSANRSGRWSTTNTIIAGAFYDDGTDASIGASIDANSRFMSKVGSGTLTRAVYAWNDINSASATYGVYARSTNATGGAIAVAGLASVGASYTLPALFSGEYQIGVFGSAGLSQTSSDPLFGVVSNIVSSGTWAGTSYNYYALCQNGTTDQHYVFGIDIDTAQNINTLDLGIIDSATTGFYADTEFIMIDSAGKFNFKSIDNLTADATPDGAADYVMTWDASASLHKKVLLNNLPGGSGGMVTGISKNSGANVNAANRSVLNFIEGTGVTLTITDDAVGDEVDITIAASGGGGGWTVSRISADPAPAVDGTYYVVHTLTGNTTITLPAASSGTRIGVKCEDSLTTYTLDIKTAAASGSKIDGTVRDTNALPINNQWDSYTLVSDGTDWFIEA